MDLCQGTHPRLYQEQNISRMFHRILGHRLTVVLPSLTLSYELMVNLGDAWVGEGSLGSCVAGVVVVADFLKLK
jgi:hypothetical protein